VGITHYQWDGGIMGLRIKPTSSELQREHVLDPGHAGDKDSKRRCPLCRQGVA